MNCKLTKELKLLWYDDNELKEATLDLSNCSSWELMRNEVAHLTSFIPKKLRKLRFQNRDGFDLEEKFTESNFFDKVISHYQEILLVDTEDVNPLHDFGRGVKPELQVQVLEATLSHVRPVTAIMEAIENSMEAIRAVQRDKKEFGIGAAYHGTIEINLDFDSKQIEIRDNGRGMSDSDVRNAVNYGRLKNRIANNGVIREKMWQTGDFGKYGIGLFTLFKFGPDVMIQIDTKQDCMRERMVSAVIDYKKMREKDQFEIEKISNPPLDTSIFPDLDSHGTRILINNVSAQFWDSCTLQSTHKLKSELQREIAEKYSLYIHGMGELKQALLKSKCAKGDLLENIQSLQHGMDSLPLIEIRIDSESMRDLANNRVVLRMAKLARCGEAEQAVGGGEGGADATGAPLPSSRGGKDARRPARRDRDDMEGQAVDEPAEVSKPCWYTSWKVETRTGSSAAMAHLVLFFNPVISGSAMDSDEGVKDAHQLMIFWQELFFREESSQLPFMRNAQEREQKDRKHGIPLDAFDRVSGFLFLDMAFAPDSNKTIISKSGDMRLELFDKESLSCTAREYQRLQEKFHEKVKAWHEEYDRMDTFEGPYKEKRRNSVEVLIWQSVTKRQSRGRKVGKALMVEEKYCAKWGDKLGDFVEVFHPDDKRHRLVGQIEYLFTRKVDGLYPSQGVVVLVRPYEGVELEFKCSSIVRKIETSEWKKLRKMMEERLPKTIHVYHQYRDDAGNIQRSLIEDGLPYQIDGEYIARDSVQISVDILDEKGQCLQSDRDKTRIVQPKYLLVKLQLFDVNGNPVRDPRSKKEWQEVLRPYNFDRTEQFNTGSGTKQFTQLSTMLAQHLPKQSRSFELEISLDYNDGSEANEDLQYRKELIDCIEHVKCRRKFEFCAGTPSKMDITMKIGDTLNIWFGLDVRGIMILFKDAAGNLIPNSLISINSISYSIDESDDRKSVKAIPLEDDQCYGIEPFRLDGWELGGKCSCRLTFEAELEQKDKRYCFSKDMDAILMSGIPDKIEAQGGFFDKMLSREHQIQCKLKLTDRWGNPFRGKHNVVTAEVSVKEQPWLRGNGNDGALIGLTDIIESTVSVDQRNLFVFLQGSYGLKDELTFRCSAIDHLANPPYRSKPIKKSIPFEVEDLDVLFNVPDSVQDKFKTYNDGSCKVIEVNHGVCDVQRKALHGIFLQIVRKGSEGSIKICSNLRCKAIFQRLKPLLNDLADFDVLSEEEDDLDSDSHSGNGAEISLDIIGGKSSVLDKHLLTDRTFSYIAKYDGLEASLRIVVIAGKPSALKFQEIGAIEIGQQTEVEFKPVDRQGLPVHDLSQYDIKLETAEHGSLLFQISEPKKKGSVNYHFQFQVLGTLPEDSPNEAKFWLVVSLVEKPSAKTRARRGELDSEISPYVVSERVQVTIHPGKAKALRILFRNRGENLAEPSEIVSGVKLEFVVNAVDLGGNIDTSCKKRVRLTLESDDPQEKYYTNEVLSNGESVIKTKPWYTRSKVGTVTIEAADKAAPRLESREYTLTVRGGVWPADIRILSPLCPAAEETFCFEVDDSSEGLRELTAEVVTPDGSKYTQSRLDLVLKQANGPVLNADFKHGKYRFNGIPIPKEPGNYTFVLTEISGGTFPSVPQKTLLVRRALGSPKSIAIITPSEIAAHADAATKVVLEVKNGLGVSIRQDVECCQGACVRFEVVECSMDLQVQHHHVEAWSYSVIFQEPSGRKVTEDVLAKLVAVLEINAREVLRAVPINVRYVPSEKLKHQSESQKRELRELQGQRTVLENRNREAEAMVRKKESLRKSLEEAKAALRALCPRSALERNIEAEEQKLSGIRRAPYMPAVPNLSVRRGANGFDAFLHDRNNGRLDPRVANSVVGVVGEMGYAQDNWAADAIAAIAGDNLQAVVVRTELDLDALWGIDRYRGIKILAMESMRSFPPLNKLGLLDLSRDTSRIPSSAKYVVNLVQLDEGANPDLRQRVWWRILKNAIAFESDEKMREHKATRGRTHTMAAPLQNGLWRMERGDISQAGQTANKFVQMKVLVEPETLPEYIEVARQLEDVKLQLSYRLRQEEEVERKRKEFEGVQAPPPSEMLQLKHFPTCEQYFNLPEAPQEDMKNVVLRIDDLVSLPSGGRSLGSELGKRVRGASGASEDGAAAGAGGQDSVGSPLRRSRRTLSGSEV